MLDIKTLLPELKKLVSDLSEDLLKRVGGNAELNTGLANAFKQIEAGGRTAQAYEVWLEDYLDQVAVAWVLSCVFIRFMEDNDLMDECYLAGEGDHRVRAEDSLSLFFHKNPNDEYRDYFLYVFREVGNIPACMDLFAEGKTPLWAVGPSGDTSMRLLDFWRERDTESGRLQRSFRTPDCDTRFLGDLYQELSDRAKDKYALLQTPVFVEEFILDRTLTPAIEEFGLGQVRMIDPTCGSGHFLLGSFTRLFHHWSKRENNERKAAQQALDGVWGVDVNPFAVAIARFRLIVAATQACEIGRLSEAPGWAVHLATGDSLLFGSRWDREGNKRAERQYLDESWAPDIYACEDKQEIRDILGQQYHVVVGNPPYITVKDKNLNKAYRERYTTCHRKYSLAVPFTERFFDLAIHSVGGHAGYVGMITANSFMKREFGKKLINVYLPTVDLFLVVDTSIAYIPGHTTSTVLLFGRSRPPLRNHVRAVLGIKGHGDTPDDPSQGVAWQSITRLVDRVDAEDEYVSTRDVEREFFNKHPWSLGGGGIAELKEKIEDAASTKLGKLASSIGFGCIMGEDDAFTSFEGSHSLKGVPDQFVRTAVEGDQVRDWTIGETATVLFPYTSQIELASDSEILSALWRFRTTLGGRRDFGDSTYAESGRNHWEYHQIPVSKWLIPYSITYAEIASHNNFVLDREGRVFKQTAPIIKLKADSPEDQYLSLLALLNSSTACFWMLQVCQCKGDGERGMESESWFRSYQLSGTKLKALPVPSASLTDYGRRLDLLASKYSGNRPRAVVAEAIPTSSTLEMHRKVAEGTLAEMISQQEELDWRCYREFGLIDEDLCYSDDSAPPPLSLGQRAFEIVMGRQVLTGHLTTLWFERHGSKPISDVPTHWPEEYQELVRRRIEVIETNKEIALIERPEHKRRWTIETWEKQQDQALRHWLLDRLETNHYWPTDKLTLQTTAQLADRATSDDAFNQVASLYRRRADFDVPSLVAELVEGEAVPFMPVLRYKAAGLRKYAIWKRTWELQRRQDSGEKIGDIALPPKYTTADFQSGKYWRLRGKLDVPRERFTSYPHCEREGDPSTVVGWAGWNHVQTATAVVAYYDARKREGWTADRLKPLLAGIHELLPWIHHLHPEVDPEYNETAGDSFQTLLESEAQELGLTLEDVREWTPPKKSTQQKKKKS